MNTSNSKEKFRIDKWLYAARFFKTRSLSANAIDSGRIQINELRAKPAKQVLIGDHLHIRIGRYQYVVEVLALSNKRGSATLAQKLYRETDDSRRKREEIAAQIKAMPQQTFLKGRPTKRDRRDISRFKDNA